MLCHFLISFLSVSAKTKINHSQVIEFTKDGRDEPLQTEREISIERQECCTVVRGEESAEQMGKGDIGDEVPSFIPLN